MASSSSAVIKPHMTMLFIITPLTYCYSITILHWLSLSSCICAGWHLLINPVATGKNWQQQATPHSKAYEFLTRSKIYPQSRRGWREEMFVDPPASMSRNPWEAKDRTFTHPICAANTAEPFPVAKVCAGKGRLPGHHDSLSCKWAELLKGLPSNSAHFFSLAWS